MVSFQLEFKKAFTEAINKKTGWGKNQVIEIFARAKSDVAFKFLQESVKPETIEFFKRFEKRFLAKLESKPNWGKREIITLVIQMEADEALESVDSYNKLGEGSINA
jgi:hypothetical protein